MRQMVMFLVKREIYEMRLELELVLHTDLFAVVQKYRTLFQGSSCKKFQNEDIRSWLMLGNHLIFS